VAFQNAHGKVTRRGAEFRPFRIYPCGRLLGRIACGDIESNRGPVREDGILFFACPIAMSFLDASC